LTDSSDVIGIIPKGGILADCSGETSVIMRRRENNVRKDIRETICKEVNN
jgi:hypothetical protein